MKNTLLSQLCGWNTWNTSSVLSHVLLPEGFSINIIFKDYGCGKIIYESLIGQFGNDCEQIIPGIRSYDGSYTELTVRLGDIVFAVQSTATNNDQYLLITPITIGKKPPAICVQAAILWNKAGYTMRNGEKLTGVIREKKIDVFVFGDRIREPHFHVTNPNICVELSGLIGICTDSSCSLQDIKQKIELAKNNLIESTKKYGELSDAYHAMRSCLAWNTIYEPEHMQFCSPVSRLWSRDWGGYVLFCWDTFFAAAMISFENKELAYSNIFAILNEITENGFVPNFGAANDHKSRDRSQPLVGAMIVWKIYERTGEKWFLNNCFDHLLRWNNWFAQNRMRKDGTLSWGSNQFSPVIGTYLEEYGVNSIISAKLESGLDNSPMYDDIPFNPKLSMMELSDVGLTGLFINDCKYLIKIATELALDYTAIELVMDKAEEGLQTLWCEEYGLFLNKRTDTGEFSYRISPTNLVP